MKTQADFPRLQKVVNAFRDEARTNQSLRDAAFAAFINGLGAWNRQSIERLPDGAMRKIGDVVTAPCRWTTYPEPDKTTLALYYLGALADLGNPDPVVPWPGTHNAPGCSEGQIGFFQSHWCMRLNWTSEQYRREIDARGNYSTFLTLDDARFNSLLAEAMWVHVRESDSVRAGAYARAVGKGRADYSPGWTKQMLMQPLAKNCLSARHFSRLRDEAGVAAPPVGRKGRDHRFTASDLKAMINVAVAWQHKGNRYVIITRKWRELLELELPSESATKRQTAK